MLVEFVEPVVLVVGAFLASELGYRLGRHYGPQGETFDKQLGLISSATFALVAFLIGSGTRYVDRLDLIVKEANVLGTSYLRADALPQPARGELKEALRQYTASRLELLEVKDRPQALALLTRVGTQHERLWDIALKGTAGNPQLMLVILPPLNEVIDLHTTHLSAARRHIPTAIMVTLLLSAALALALASFGNGQAGRRFTILNFMYGLALAAAVWMTLDLDHPRRGTIQITVQPLVETLTSMKP